MSREIRRVQSSTETFICKFCGQGVGPAESGTKNRNHCPHCLHSLHVDLSPGDRRSSCFGLMIPIGLWSERKETRIIHRCTKCGLIKINRLAGDDNERALLALALAPVRFLPFPLELLKQGASNE